MGVITRLLNSRQSSTKIICLPPYLSPFCLYYIKEFPFKPCKFKSKLFSQPSSVDCNNTVQTMFAFVLDHLFSVTTATVSQSCWTRCDYTWRHDNTHFSCLRQTCPWVCLALHCYVCVTHLIPCYQTLFQGVRKSYSGDLTVKLLAGFCLNYIRNQRKDIYISILFILQDLLYVKWPLT